MMYSRLKVCSRIVKNEIIKLRETETQMHSGGFTAQQQYRITYRWVSLKINPSNNRLNQYISRHPPTNRPVSCDTQLLTNSSSPSPFYVTLSALRTGWTFPPNKSSPFHPVQCRFLLQTQLMQVVHNTFLPCLPSPVPLHPTVRINLIHSAVRNPIFIAIATTTNRLTNPSEWPEHVHRVASWSKNQATCLRHHHRHSNTQQQHICLPSQSDQHHNANQTTSISSSYGWRAQTNVIWNVLARKKNNRC